jgi:hypothetical protein
LSQISIRARFRASSPRICAVRPKNCPAQAAFDTLRAILRNNDGREYPTFAQDAAICFQQAFHLSGRFLKWRDHFAFTVSATSRRGVVVVCAVGRNSNLLFLENETVFDF